MVIISLEESKVMNEYGMQDSLKSTNNSDTAN